MKKSRLFGLDVVKVMAILGVILFHLLDFQNNYLASASLNTGKAFDYFISNGQSPAISILSAFIIIFGLAGVNLFFIASGFGLYQSQKQNELSCLGFYVKRFWKILPLYWLALVLSLGYFLYSGLPISFGDYLTHFLGIHTFFPEFRFGILGPLWFMGTLIQLYLLFPFLYKFVSKQRKELVYAVGIGSFIVSWCVIAVWWPRIIPTTHYLWEFMFGMLLADYNGKRGIQNIGFGRLFLLIATVLVVGFFVATFANISSFESFAPSIMRIGLSLISLVVFWITINFVNTKTIFSKIFRHLTTIIFAVYLFHEPFLILFIPKLKVFPFWQSVLILLPALYIMGRLLVGVDRILIHFLSRLFPRQIL